MHWLGYKDAVSWLNEAKARIFQPTVNFEILEFTCISSASLFAVRSVGVGLQNDKLIKVMAADLRKCCSEDYLPTAPW